MTRLGRATFTRQTMTEHFCPYCRRELMTEDHSKECRMGQTLHGQIARVGLHLLPVQNAIYAEARQSLWGRFAFRIVTWIYGPMQ